MKLTKRQLQPPFRQKDLLFLSTFIRYCRDRGVDTTERQLEYYEKEKLLLPAVRVNHGFVQFRKVLMEYEGRLQWRFVFKKRLNRFKYEDIDKHIYYGYGSIDAIGDNWLDEYKKRGLVEYPAESEFREWKTYKGTLPRKSGFLTEKPLPMHEIFYSRFQVFPLKQIRDGLRMVVSDLALFVNDEEWQEIGKFRRMFAHARQIQQRKVLRHYETLRLLQDILDLRNELFSAAEKAYESALEEGESEKDARLEARATLRREEKEEAPKRARSIRKKRRLPLKQIHERREEFLNLAVKADPISRLFRYLGHIPEDYLDSCRGDYAFARDCYRVVSHLGWFLQLFGEEVPSVEKMVTGTDRFRICVICKKPFEPDRKTRVTCGKKKCKREYQNLFKREMRRKGYIE